MLTGESTASHKIEIPNDNNLLNEFDILNSEQVSFTVTSDRSNISDFQEQVSLSEEVITIMRLLLWQSILDSPRSKEG